MYTEMIVSLLGLLAVIVLAVVLIVTSTANGDVDMDRHNRYERHYKDRPNKRL